MPVNPSAGDPFGGVSIQDGQGNAWWYAASREEKHKINTMFERRYPGRTLAAQRAIKFGLLMAWDEGWGAYRGQAIARDPNTPMVDVYDGYYEGRSLDDAEGPKPGYHSSNPLPTVGEYADLYRSDTEEGAVFRNGDLADVRHRPIWFRNQNPQRSEKAIVQSLASEVESLETRIERLEAKLSGGD